MQTAAYVLDNQHPVASDHHQALAGMLDPHTVARVSNLPEWPGIRRCLEVGAGGGSMSRWLAEQVGPLGGRVTAADIKTDHLIPGPHLDVRQVDLSDDRLADVLGDQYDLILARMVLQHVPDRRRVLTTLSTLLAPGGVLLVEGWVVADPDGPDVVIRAPDPAAGALYERCRRAVLRQLITSGVDTLWQRAVHSHMQDDGLVGVDTAIRGEYWTTASPGMRHMVTTAAQLAPQLAEVGITEPEIDQLRDLVNQGSWLVQGHLLYSTIGRTASPADSSSH